MNNQSELKFIYKSQQNHSIYNQKMDSADQFQSSSLDPRTISKTYLVTYSQANRNLFPTRESFGQSVADAFNKRSSKVKVLYWACCWESHQNERDHYHYSIKLSGSKRWKAVKGALKKESGIQVHFQMLTITTGAHSSISPKVTQIFSLVPIILTYKK